MPKGLELAVVVVVVVVKVAVVVKVVVVVVVVVVAVVVAGSSKLLDTKYHAMTASENPVVRILAVALDHMQRVRLGGRGHGTLKFRV